MASLTDMLATIDQRVEAIDAERAELVAARAALVKLFGPTGASVPASASPRPPKATAPQEVCQPRPSTRAERDGRILALLKTPLSSTVLAARLAIKPNTVVYTMNRLIAAKKVTRVGKGRSTEYQAI